MGSAAIGTWRGHKADTACRGVDHGAPVHPIRERSLPICRSCGATAWADRKPCRCRGSVPGNGASGARNEKSWRGKNGRAWLYAIMTNLESQQIARQGARAPSQIDRRGGDGLPIRYTRTDPLIRDQLMRALGALKPEARAVLHARRDRGLHLWRGCRDHRCSHGHGHVASVAGASANVRIAR